MSLAFYVVTDIIHLIKIILLCNMFFMFEKRYNNRKKIVVVFSVIFTALSSCITYLCDNKVIGTIVYLLSIIIIMSVFYKEKITSLVMYAIWIVLITSMLDLMSVVLVDTTVDLCNYKNNEITKLIAAFVSLFIIFIFGNIYNKKYCEGIKTIGKANLLLFTLLAVADTFVVMVIALMTVNEHQRFYRVLYSMAFIFVILGIFLQLGAVILLFMQRNVYKEKKQIIEKYLNEQQGHYEYLERREIETKKFRHDLRNHMQMLSNMAKDHQYDKFDRYLEKIDIKIESFGNIITVQNGIVDAIINQYYSKALQNNVKMEVKGRFPEDCAIDAYDLCTMFSNVLSNALEAATETEEKIITVDCRYTDKNIIVVVKNSFNNVGQFGNGQMITHKEDVDYHGYGLENIKDSIEKYNGVLDIDIKNDMFILTLLFNYTEKREYENSNCR